MVTMNLEKVAHQEWKVESGPRHSENLSGGRSSCPSYPIRDGANKGNSDKPPVPDAPPWEAWELAESPTSHCGIPIHLRHRQNRQRQIVVPGFCGKCNCTICGPFLKRKWISHLTGHVSEAQTIFLVVITKPQWPTIYRRIRRASGDFAKIELEDRHLVIITTVEEGVELPASLRAGVLKAALDAATFSHRFVSTSRGWALPREEPEDSEWERVSMVAGTLDEAKTVAKDLGLSVKEFGYMGTKGLGRGFEVKIPASWLEDNELGFKRFCDWLAYGPLEKSAKDVIENDVQQ